MSDDLAAILGGVSTPASTPPRAKTYDPTDAAIRTVYGEAPANATKEERQAIAAVIVNRAKKAGKTYDQVVQEAGQFEPWSDAKARKRIDALKPTDPDYQAISADVGDILAGKSNPHPELTHFYAPDAQSALGRAKPSWDDGKGTRIGASLFFANPGEGGSDDLAAMLGGAGGDAAPTTPEGEKTATTDADKAYAEQFGDPTKFDEKADMAGAGLVPFKGAKGTLNKEQTAAHAQMVKGNAYRPEDPAGTPYNPLWMTADTSEKDVPPDTYYRDAKGLLKHSPGGEDKSSLKEGLGRGVGDVMLSAAELLPGTGDSELRNRFKVDQEVYDADYKGDLKSGIGRFTGQVAASAPMLAGAEAAIAPKLASLVPAGANAIVRGGAAALGGAAEGAGAAALTSSASDAPLSEQMAAGAAGGAVLKPVMPLVRAAGQGAGRVVRSFVEPLTEGGREKIANRIVGEVAGGPLAPNTAELVPGSTPTLGQASDNAGVAALERNARTHPRLAQRFVERDAQNAEARSAVLDAARGDEHTVADLVSTRQRAVTKARDTALANTTPVDSQPLVSAIDEALEAPAAHMEEVARPLQAIRDKIAQPPAETTPQQRAEFQRQVARSFGADAPALTPEVMSEARSRLGGKFEEIADKTSMKWDNKALSDVVRVISDTAQVVPESSMPPLFKQLANIASTVKNGENISGASYQALTRKGAPLSTLQQSGDPTIRDAANRIREALDDALERSVEGEPAGKALLGELRDTRLAYKNLKTAEAALKTAGPDKLVTPQAIMSAVKRNFGQFAYKGGGPLGDAAETALKEEAARPPRLETDARQLHGMRESLSGAIEKLEAKGGDANTMAADHLKAVRDHLDTSIETGAKGYREFLKLAERSAEPIEATKYLQSLKLTDVQGKPALSRVNSALERIADARSKPGKHPAKAISEATLHQLETLRADLLREKGIDLGRARGSDTVQNLVMGNVAGKAGVPIGIGAALGGNPIVGAALGAGKMFYGMKGDQILDAVGSRLLNPEATAVTAPVVRKAGKVGRAAKRLAAPALPAAGGILSSRLLAQ